MNLDKELISEINLLVKELVDQGVTSENNSNTLLRSQAIRFLKENDLIKSSPNKKFQYHSTSEIHKINQEGIKKYLKRKGKSEWYNQNWVGYLIAFVVFLFSVYQYFDNQTLQNDFDSLKKEYSLIRTLFLN